MNKFPAMNKIQSVVLVVLCLVAVESSILCYLYHPSTINLQHAGVQNLQPQTQLNIYYSSLVLLIGAVIILGIIIINKIKISDYENSI